MNWLKKYFGKNYTNFSLYFLCLLIVCLPIYSQNKKITFQALQDGLSHQFVKCIFKDSKGFMWFGTNDGLNKFDGTNFPSGVYFYRLQAKDYIQTRKMILLK